MSVSLVATRPVALSRVPRPLMGPCSPSSRMATTQSTRTPTGPTRGVKWKSLSPKGSSTTLAFATSTPRSCWSSSTCRGARLPFPSCSRSVTRSCTRRTWCSCARTTASSSRRTLHSGPVTGRGLAEAHRLRAPRCSRTSESWPSPRSTTAVPPRSSFAGTTSAVLPRCQSPSRRSVLPRTWQRSTVPSSWTTRTWQPSTACTSGGVTACGPRRPAIQTIPSRITYRMTTRHPSHRD
mmetsp:Transcript_16429/g.51379  ORF Transcript_16429/g.51379 Transcript_16429/m.51379 type:complete len:237 (-) Transcript_16429:230-940(-)